MATPVSNPEAIARQLLNELYDENPCMPVMVRYAFHDAGTFDLEAKTGGANGSIRNSIELDYPPNVGLSKARDILDDIMNKIKEQDVDMSFADLIQLAGVAAVSRCNGPKIPFRMGREDVEEEDMRQRLPFPNMSLDELREVFSKMGFNDQELVALSGAHTLGRCHPENVGIDGPWTKEEKIFDNEYFKRLLEEPLEEGLVQLTTDVLLLSDPATRKWVEDYAQDGDMFLSDYAKVHQKMSELGMRFVEAEQTEDEDSGNTEEKEDIDVGQTETREDEDDGIRLLRFCAIG